MQGKACTQIDFILAREISAGRQAKQASPVLDFALGSWKKEGHRPVLASVTPVRHWNLPGPQVKPLQHDSAALQEAIPANSPQAQRMLEWVTEHLDLDSGPQAWDELLSGATERFFPKTAVALPDCPATTVARRLWRTRREDTEHPLTELQAEQRRALQEQHRQAVKQAREACPNAPPEGAARSAGGAMGASCESGELCRLRLCSGLLTFSDMVDHNLKSCGQACACLKHAWP